MARLDKESLTDIRAYVARRYDDAGWCPAGEVSFAEAALQVWTKNERGFVPEKAEDREELSVEARIEWLESAVESILQTVQVRPPDQREVPPETPDPKGRAGASRKRAEIGE